MCTSDEGWTHQVLFRCSCWLSIGFSHSTSPSFESSRCASACSGFICMFERGVNIAFRVRVQADQFHLFHLCPQFHSRSDDGVQYFGFLQAPVGHTLHTKVAPGMGGEQKRWWFKHLKAQIPLRDGVCMREGKRTTAVHGIISYVAAFLLVLI